MKSIKKYLEKMGVLYITSYDGESLTIQSKDVPKIEKHISRYYKGFSIELGNGYFDGIASIVRC